MAARRCVPAGPTHADGLAGDGAAGGGGVCVDGGAAGDGIPVDAGGSVDDGGSVGVALGNGV
ncbi:MAG: hypothetical protein K2P80_05180 [Beijerinckiaceae bacterium]|nr:hypothetical protein [Beijerinckiaceae bacterium]